MTTKQTTFTNSIPNPAGNLRTVYVRIADRLEGDYYLYSFNGGGWKWSEALGTRHGLSERYRFSNSYRLLSDAKDSVKVSERTLKQRQ